MFFRSLLSGAFVYYCRMGILERRIGLRNAIKLRSSGEERFRPRLDQFGVNYTSERLQNRVQRPFIKNYAGKYKAERIASQVPQVANSDNHTLFQVRSVDQSLISRGISIRP